jgi:D-beta-D-heptose 7-phosphate kinase / D-beta-D-heptose 1-phosphate adenosyltransferase
MLNKQQIRDFLTEDHPSDRPILVAGDAMLDAYYHGKVERISPEAPVPIFHKSNEEIVLGGACNVARNMRVFTKQVILLSVTGDDKRYKRLQSLLHDAGIQADLVIPETGRETIIKTRIIANNQQQLLRIDEETPHDCTPQSIQLIKDRLKNHLEHLTGVIIADYLKGSLPTSLLHFLIDECIQRNIPVLVDSKHPDYMRYSNATLLKPNRQECERLFGIRVDPTDPNLKNRLKMIKSDMGVKELVITLGKGGILVSDSNHTLTHLKTRTQHVYDVTGAGDVVLAWLMHGYMHGLPLLETAMLANIAGTISVSRLGTTVVGKEEVLRYINEHEFQSE